MLGILTRDINNDLQILELEVAVEVGAFALWTIYPRRLPQDL